jgi:hypothetical protein
MASISRTPDPVAGGGLGYAAGGSAGMMIGPMGGGELVGPGGPRTDSISSLIYPNTQSKLSGDQRVVQPAALSDGEYVITADAVKCLGKMMGAKPGAEREIGSKGLDDIMRNLQSA